MCRYLQTSHTRNCSCDICYNAYNRLILFQIGSLYNRISYLNETDAQTKQSIQLEIYDYWSKHLKASESSEPSDSFLVDQSRMLMWCAHVKWKFGKNCQQAKMMLDESLERLRKVEKFDCAMEHDLLGQIEILTNEMMMVNSTRSGSNVSTLNQKKSFIEKESPAKKTQTQPVIATKKVIRPFINIFDEKAPEIRPKPVKFQIHDDESPDADPTKKPTKKVASSRKIRSQKDVKSEEKSVVDLTTPPSAKNEISVVESSPEPLTQQSAKKQLTRPNRGKCHATSDNGDGEILAKPTRTTRKRAEKIEAENTPVTRAPRSRREHK